MAPKNQEPEAKPPGDTPPPALTTTPPVGAPAVETKTPAAWAAALGHTKPRDPRLPQSVDHVDPSYAVADRLYGWSKHAYDFQGPEWPEFVISRATYLTALRSAPQFPAVDLVADALTPEAAELLKDHKPARNLKVERAAAEAGAAEAKVSS